MSNIFFEKMQSLLKPRQNTFNTIDAGIKYITSLPNLNAEYLSKEYLAAIIYGSVAEGLCTPYSDVDILLVSTSNIIIEEKQKLLPSGIHIEINEVSATRVDVLKKQVSDEKSLDINLTNDDARLLHNLLNGVELFPSEWLSNLRSSISRHKLALAVSAQHAILAHTLYKDTLGFVAIDDKYGALSCGRRLAEVSMDWISSIHGETSPVGKWRYLRYIHHKSEKDNLLLDAFMHRLHKIILEEESEILIILCLDMYQRASDYAALYDHELFNEILLKKIINPLHSSGYNQLRAVNHYLARKGDEYFLVIDGVPAFCLNSSYILAWISFGSMSNTESLTDTVVTNTGVDIAKAKSIIKDFLNSGSLLNIH